MKQFTSFPDIKQFRNVVANIKHQATYLGQDENDQPIYDPNQPLPVLKATGTVKLHGTNAGVCFDAKHGFWAQSRNDVITPEKDNAGFAFFAHTNEAVFMKMIHEVAQEHQIDLQENTIAIYGEWAGKGIQKGMGITELDKFFAIFALKVRPLNGDTAYWLDCTKLKNPEKRIYNINDFETFEVEIDFNQPGEAQNQMIDQMLKVEAECPFAKTLGASGIGEGIVFITWFKGNRHIWKVKGEKHANSKVKKLKKVDNAKLQLIQETAQKVTPAWRLEQMYQKTFDTLNGGVPTKEGTGDFLRNVVQDVMKEDMDLIAEAGLEPKQVNGAISKIARVWLFEQLDKEVGL